MKKTMVLCAGLTLAFAFTGCKSSESAYRKVYEKAAVEEAAKPTTPPVEETPNVVAPVLTEKPADEVKVVDNSDNVQVKEETVSLVSGSGLKAFSVVVGSFMNQANAEGLQATLKQQGYDAQLVKNTERNMFRVVATTFENKADAAASRNELRQKFEGAWLLYQK